MMVGLAQLILMGKICNICYQNTATHCKCKQNKTDKTFTPTQNKCAAEIGKTIIRYDKVTPVVRKKKKK